MEVDIPFFINTGFETGFTLDYISQSNPGLLVTYYPVEKVIYLFWYLKIGLGTVMFMLINGESENAALFHTNSSNKIIKNSVKIIETFLSIC